jgi:hypothetical protein
MNDISVNDYLTWEYCSDPEIQYLQCPPPEPMNRFIPNWFKNQKALKQEIQTHHGDAVADRQTIRNCLGFRGICNLGYTIPLPEKLTCHDTYFNRGRLHPEMLYGTKWANKGRKPWTQEDNSLYEYSVRLLHWPWRAKMKSGWRLVILPYLLDWSDDWNEFAGMVDPNYNICDGTSIGTAMKWHQRIDTNYNYYNLETVIALKRATVINKEKVTFCAVPLYDPLLKEKTNEMDS